MAYGKALSTYKRINKIKRSAEKIAEAQNMIGEQRAKSMAKARDLQSRKQVASAVAGAIQTGAAYGMSQSNNINPDTASKISAGLGGAVGVGEALFTPMDQEEFLGLSPEQYRNLYQTSQPDVAGNAIKGYALQESLNEIRKRRDFENAEIEDNVYGLRNEQMAPYMNEVEFKKGVGYDFSQLPRITNRNLRDIQIQRGLIDDPLQEDTPDEEFDLMNAFDFIKNNEPNFLS